MTTALAAWGYLTMVVVAASLLIAAFIRAMEQDDAEDEFYAVTEWNEYRDALRDATGPRVLP